MYIIQLVLSLQGGGYDYVCAVVVPFWCHKSGLDYHQEFQIKSQTTGWFVPHAASGEFQ